MELCNILDGKSYELFQLLVQFYDALKDEADRAGITLETSQINKVIREGQELVYRQVSLIRRQLTNKSSDEDLTEPLERVLSQPYIFSHHA